MSSIQTDAITIGLETALAVTGEEITYHRGATELTFDALRGNRVSELIEPRAYAQTQAELRDWMFPAAELTGQTPATPAIGDWIELAGAKYPLAAAEDGKVFRWMDPAETWLRVHTVRGGTV